MKQAGSTLSNEHGVVAVIVALLMVVFLGVAALAVDVGYKMMAGNEAQDAADAAALAGARQMGENYQTSLPATTNVSTVAETTAKANKVTGKLLAANNIGIQTLVWNPTSDPNITNLNAVRAEVKRETGLANGPIDTFFGRIWGIAGMKEGAVAIASLSGTCVSDNPLPMGIGKSWFANLHANNYCTQIALNDTMSSCAGWTNLSSQSYKQKDVQDILEGKTPWPTIHSGDTVQFGGGTTTPILNDLVALFNDPTKFTSQKTIVAGVVKDWTTTVVVYDDGGVCGNPNTAYKVLGFATIKITGIQTTGSNKGPYGQVVCNMWNDEPGGCFNAGTYGTLPGLVQ
jgi:hypothetical protein